jgi:FkbM family methyltransferase
MENKFFEILSENKVIETLLSLIHRVLWRLAPFIFKLMHTTSREDYLMSYRPFLASDRDVIGSDYEKTIRAIFLPKPGDTVVDVGANIGIYTVISSRRVQPGGKVISIEPDESNLAVLRNNILINKCQNVTVVPIAMSSSNGEKKFYEGIMPTASSFYPEDKRLLYKVRKEKTVKTATLDSVLKELGIEEVEWIKIDVEKADLEVLWGSNSILRHSKNVKVVVEASSPKTFDYLNSLGFETDTATGFAFKPRENRCAR